MSEIAESGPGTGGEPGEVPPGPAPVLESITARDNLTTTTVLKAQGVPIWLVGAAVCAAGALGIVLGIRVGRALGGAVLMEPPKVEALRVPCKACEERAIADAMAATKPGDVEAMLAKQRAVQEAE